MTYLFRMGWGTPVGSVGDVQKAEHVAYDDIVYRRLVLRDFRLSHAAALFLLQGASIRELFERVSLDAAFNDFFSVGFSSPPSLYLPPPSIAYVVLAQVTTPSTLGDSFAKIFRSEIARCLRVDFTPLWV